MLGAEDGCVLTELVRPVKIKVHFLVIATMEVVLGEPGPPKSVDVPSRTTRACLGSGPKRGLKDNTQTERVLKGEEEACCGSFEFL